MELGGYLLRLDEDVWTNFSANFVCILGLPLPAESRWRIRGYACGVHGTDDVGKYMRVCLAGSHWESWSVAAQQIVAADV